MQTWENAKNVHETGIMRRMFHIFLGCVAHSINSRSQYLLEFWVFSSVCFWLFLVHMLMNCSSGPISYFFQNGLRSRFAGSHLFSCLYISMHIFTIPPAQTKHYCLYCNGSNCYSNPVCTTIDYLPAWIFRNWHIRPTIVNWGAWEKWIRGF